MSPIIYLDSLRTNILYRKSPTLIPHLGDFDSLTHVILPPWD